jgi:hypothetical protein
LAGCAYRSGIFAEKAKAIGEKNFRQDNMMSFLTPGDAGSKQHIKNPVIPSKNHAKGIAR